MQKKKRVKIEFFILLLAELGFYIVGVGAIDDPLLSRGINTYAKHVCWRRRDRGRTLFAREET